MIVDDSTDLLEALEIILFQKGYTVKTLTDGKNIYKEINDFDPDLLILDIFLAGKAWREICRELRKRRFSKYLRNVVFFYFVRALDVCSAFGA